MADVLRKRNWVEDQAGDWWYVAPSGKRRRERGEIRTCGRCLRQFPQMKGNPGLYCSHSCRANSFTPHIGTRPDLFEQWSHDECWLTGLIWSDGCLLRRSEGPGWTVRLTMTDEDVIAHASSITGAKYRSLAARDATRKPQHVLDFGDRNAIARLEKVGLRPRKSASATWPDLPHPTDFLRGAFDGDGGVFIDVRDRLRSSLCGSREFLAGANKLLASKGVTPKTIRRNGRSLCNWQLEWQSSDSLRLQEILYSAGGPCMGRKKAVFDRYWATHHPSL